MAKLAKFLQGVAGAGGAGALNVEDVFSTYLYDGTGSAQTITNGIDLSGEGGLVWIKERDATSIPVIYDTERGVGKLLRTNDTNAETDLSASSLGITAYNSNGFSLGGTTNNDNDSGINHASWTFRKAPKFFDVVTYTGTGSGGLVVNHDLGATPGMIVVKKTSDTGFWRVWHTATGNAYGNLNLTSSFFTGAQAVWGDGSSYVTPTDTSFTVGTDHNVNSSGQTYVAYLFAHNDGDGDFGPTGDQDIIKCGSYAGSASAVTVNLGFEPQWVMIKNTTLSNANSNWIMIDSMRGHGSSFTTTNSQTLKANSSDEEKTQGRVNFTADGLYVDAYGDSVNSSGSTYIYIAIRRGPMAVPESATDVFQVGTVQNNTPKDVSPASDFPVDFVLHHAAANSSTGNKLAINRLATDLLYTNLTGGAYGNYSSYSPFDHMDNVQLTGLGAANGAAWMWRRAPNFCDVVAYTGNGTAGRTVSHNLGVAPEMMWVKQRNTTRNWCVYHKDTGNTDYMFLDLTNPSVDGFGTGFWDDTTPSDTSFTLGSSSFVNQSGGTYIAYLFASLDGVSKLGSVTIQSGSTTVDCGFSGGPRFVLLKRTDNSSSWNLFDSERGIVAGNDPYLNLNQTAAEITGNDLIDPTSSGFTLTSLWTAGQTWIYYAIA